MRISSAWGAPSSSKMTSAGRQDSRAALASPLSCMAPESQGVAQQGEPLVVVLHSHLSVAQAVQGHRLVVPIAGRPEDRERLTQVVEGLAVAPQFLVCLAEVVECHGLDIGVADLPGDSQGPAETADSFSELVLLPAEKTHVEQGGSFA